MRYINGTRLDDRIIRTDWDAGFVEGRQYGRGKTGGQVCVHFIPHVTINLPIDYTGDVLELQIIPKCSSSNIISILYGL
jgi:hypothetical protein